MQFKAIFFAAMAATLPASAQAAAISQVAYSSLTGTQIINVDSITPSNFDTILVANGVRFGERFAGQTLGYSGDFDTLSGTPTGPLQIVAGAANQNVSIFLNFGHNILSGLGNKEYPNYSAIGEGSVAMLFSSGQSQFGFQLVGGNGGSASVSFFKADGALIDTVTISNLSFRANTFYGFSRDGGVNDIRGISITNTDTGGVSFNNIKYDVVSVAPGVPEPTSWAMLIAGFGLVGAAARRRRTRIA